MGPPNPLFFNHNEPAPVKESALMAEVAILAP